MDRLAAMETFLRVVETRSFSAAARLLSVGQPAVSKSIAHLEARLGVQLIVRSTRGLAPTEAGQLFYEHTRCAIYEADQADSAARGAGADLVGHLRVAAAVTFAQLHVVPRLPAFLAEYPKLSIDFILDDRVTDFVAERADVVLRMGASLASSSATARKLGTSRRTVVGTPAYFKRAGVPTTPADLVRHEAVTYVQNELGDRWLFKRADREILVRLSSRIRISAAEGLRAAVLSDMGLTIASEWMFAPELATGAVCALRINRRRHHPGF